MALNFFLIKKSKLDFKIIIYCFLIFISFTWWQFNNAEKYESNWKKNSKIIDSEEKCINSKIFVYQNVPARIDFYYYYLNKKSNIKLVNIYNKKNLVFSKEIFSSKCPYKIWIERHPLTLIKDQVSLIKEYSKNEINLDLKHIIKVDKFSYIYKINN